MVHTCSLVNTHTLIKQPTLTYSVFIALLFMCASQKKMNCTPVTWNGEYNCLLVNNNIITALHFALPLFVS